MTRVHRSDHLINEIGVVVPARDEAALIGRCVAGLIAARGHTSEFHPRVSVRIVVVADGCTDETADVARSYEGAGVEVITTDAARVGAARASGVLRVVGERDAVDLAQLWLAHTDADSIVPVHWLSHQVELADSGADVMVGTVRPDPEDLTADQNARWLETHERGRPNGHVHGANLGLTASAYMAVGGFDAVTEHEDNLLVDRLRTSGARIVASDVAEVLTSGRRIGRTPGGYAAYLEQALGGAPEAAEVAS